MMPNEKIPFHTKEHPDQWLYADLLESRSIGGLSGSPVFIRRDVATGCAPRRQGQANVWQHILVFLGCQSRPRGKERCRA